MDGYYLNKEDWDTIVELGVGSRKDTDVLKNVATATKTAFTKTYNASDHPIAFHKGTDVGGIKKIAAKDVPDIEEAFDVSVIRTSCISPLIIPRLTTRFRTRTRINL